MEMNDLLIESIFTTYKFVITSSCNFSQQLVWNNTNLVFKDLSGTQWNYSELCPLRGTQSTLILTGWVQSLHELRCEFIRKNEKQRVHKRKRQKQFHLLDEIEK